MKRKLIACVLVLIVLFSGCSVFSPEPTEITVMSWNLLNPSWGGTPVDMRTDAFLNTLNTAQPDVLGVQEASTPWHNAFDALPAQYALACDTSNGGKDNMTMFIYNTDTLSLVESGVKDLDRNSNIRVVSWAVFADNRTDTKFLITNTHPDSREAECIAHTQQYLDIVSKLYTEKELPLLSVGDFNAVEESDAYQLHMDDGFTDAKYAEGVDLITDVDSYLLGDFGGKLTIGQGSRDHIFFKGDVTPLTFDTLHSDNEKAVSDHLPVTAKIML